MSQFVYTCSGDRGGIGKLLKVFEPVSDTIRFAFEKDHCGHCAAGGGAEVRLEMRRATGSSAVVQVTHNEGVLT